MIKKDMVIHFLIYTGAFLLIWPILEYLFAIISGNTYTYDLATNIRTAFFAGLCYSMITYCFEKNKNNKEKKRK